MKGYVRLNVGDEAEMRKPHACGRNAWRILRKGTDVRIECLGCGRRLLLPREKFLAGLKCLRPGASPPES
jgi:hypothetical protein